MNYIDITRYVIAVMAFCLMIWSLKKYVATKDNEYEQRKYAQLSFLYGALAFCLISAKVTVLVTFY